MGASGSTAVQAEARATWETADRLARGERQEGADEIRVLAGMIAKLAEQVYRVAGGSTLATAASSAGPEAGTPAGAEDVSPEDAPAEPATDA